MFTKEEKSSSNPTSSSDTFYILRLFRNQFRQESARANVSASSSEVKDINLTSPVSGSLSKAEIEELTQSWKSGNNNFIEVVYTLLANKRINPSILGRELQKLKVPFSFAATTDLRNESRHLSDIVDIFNEKYQKCSSKDTADELLALSFRFEELLLCDSSPDYVFGHIFIDSKFGLMWDNGFLDEDKVLTLLKHCLEKELFQGAYALISKIKVEELREGYSNRIWQQVKSRIECPRDILTDSNKLWPWADRLNKAWDLYSGPCRAAPEKYYPVFYKMITDEILPEFIKAVTHFYTTKKITVLYPTRFKSLVLETENYH